MYFCPNCNNIFDITKKLPQQGGALDYEKIIKKILDDESIKESDVYEINTMKLIKDPLYKKLSSEDKEKVINIIEETKPIKQKHVVQDSDSPTDSHTYFICNNCTYRRKIDEETLIYSKSNNTTYSSTSSVNKVYSKILPLTRKYNCPNETCITHKKSELKEAVIFRQPNTYVTKYLCKSCKTEWA